MASNSPWDERKVMGKLAKGKNKNREMYVNKMENFNLYEKLGFAKFKIINHINFAWLVCNMDLQ